MRSELLSGTPQSEHILFEAQCNYYLFQAVKHNIKGAVAGLTQEALWETLDREDFEGDLRFLNGVPGKEKVLSVFVE